MAADQPGFTQAFPGRRVDSRVLGGGWHGGRAVGFWLPDALLPRPPAVNRAIGQRFGFLARYGSGQSAGRRPDAAGAAPVRANGSAPASRGFGHWHGSCPWTADYRLLADRHHPADGRYDYQP